MVSQPRTNVSSFENKHHRSLRFFHSRIITRYKSNHSAHCSRTFPASGRSRFAVTTARRFQTTWHPWRSARLCFRRRCRSLSTVQRPRVNSTDTCTCTCTSTCTCTCMHMHKRSSQLLTESRSQKRFSFESSAIAMNKQKRHFHYKRGD